MTITHFRFCRVIFKPESSTVITRFPDGTEAHACPHDTPEYHAHAVEKTGEDDILRYCLEHDVAHVLIGEAAGGPSPVLWAIAHGEDTTGPLFDLEEAAAQALQKFLTVQARRANPCQISRTKA
jgi:hypothetical protein